MEHKVSYFGGRVSGYGWRCSCGEGRGPKYGNHPFEEAYDRTMEAHEHLIAVGQPPRWARSGS